MISNKAYKFRIYPNKEQTILINKTIGCSRFIYNKMLNDKVEYYKETKSMLKNSPAQYKTEFEWLKEVDSLALANAQMNLDKAFNNFFSKNKKGKNSGFPKFKSKKVNNLSYTTNNQKESIRIENKKIKLPKIGFVKIIEHRKICENEKIKSVTVSQTATGKYFVSILVEYENQVLTKDIKTFIGLDFTMNGLYIDSNGSSANYPKYYKKSMVKLAKKQKTLSRCKLKSNNYQKQKRKVTLIHEKIKNQRLDFLHKQSKILVNNYDCVCIEDLNMQEMSKTMNFGKSVHDNSWGMFTSFLDYKLKSVGGILHKVDKWFPSSKTCSFCGTINKELKLSDRTWQCNQCGVVHNRDENAANNIRTAGMVGLARVNLRQ